MSQIIFTTQGFEIKIIHTHKFVGLEYQRYRDGSIGLHQKSYVTDLIRRYGLENSTIVATPMEPGQSVTSDGCERDSTRFREILGALQFAASKTRLDIAFSVDYLSRHVLKPSKMDWQILDRILRYLNGTDDWGILYKPGEDLELAAYADADYAGDGDSYRSTSGQVISANGSPVSWKSKLQGKNVSSTTEAEFVAVSSTIKNVLCLRDLSRQIGLPDPKPTPILCDNKGAVQIITNDASAQRTRHLGAQLFFAKDQHNRKNVAVKWIDGREQTADILTKPLRKDPFIKNRNALMSIILLSVVLSIVSPQTGWAQLELQKTNYISWAKLPIQVEEGTTRYTIKTKIPDRCDLLRRKAADYVEGKQAFSFLIESLITRCESLVEQKISPLWPQISTLKFETVTRYPRQAQSGEAGDKFVEQINELEKPSDAEFWSSRLVPPIQTALEFNKMGSTYNAVHKHDRQLNTVRQILRNHTHAFQLMQNSTDNNIEILRSLTEKANELHTKINDFEKITPALLQLSSETMTKIYSDHDALLTIISALKRKRLDALALSRYSQSTAPTSLWDTEGNRVESFIIDSSSVTLTCVFNRAIIDTNSYVFEAIAFKEWTSETYYRFPKLSMFALYNATTNCSTLIRLPKERYVGAETRCIESNRSLTFDNIEWAEIQLTTSDYEEMTKPVIYKTPDQIFVQCYPLNITFWSNVTQKFPFVNPLCCRSIQWLR